VGQNIGAVPSTLSPAGMVAAPTLSVAFLSFTQYVAPAVFIVKNTLWAAAGITISLATLATLAANKYVLVYVLIGKQKSDYPEVLLPDNFSLTMFCFPNIGCFIFSLN